MNLTDEKIKKDLIKRKIKQNKKLKRRRFIKKILFLLIIISAALIGYKYIFNNSQFPCLTKDRGTIFIDPGHGGEDPGAESGDRQEKEDTLRISLKVKSALEKKGFTVCMSRTTDIDVDRTKRANMANACNADIFVSIHRNKAVEGQGVEIWINSSDPADSHLLADNLFKNIEAVGITQNREVHTGTVIDSTDNYKENALTEMPSCIIEFGFISDAEDNELFDKNIDEYAEAMSDGIEETFTSLYEKNTDE